MDASIIIQIAENLSSTDDLARFSATSKLHSKVIAKYRASISKKILSNMKVFSDLNTSYKTLKNISNIKRDSDKKGYDFSRIQYKDYISTWKIIKSLPEINLYRLAITSGNLNLANVLYPTWKNKKKQIKTLARLISVSNSSIHVVKYFDKNHREYSWIVLEDYIRKVYTGGFSALIDYYIKNSNESIETVLRHLNEESLDVEGVFIRYLNENGYIFSKSIIEYTMYWSLYNENFELLFYLKGISDRLKYPISSGEVKDFFRKI